jgi:hypothetical protein
MDDRASGRHLLARMRVKPCDQIGIAAVGEDQKILPVPGLDPIIVPNLPSQEIKAAIVLTREFFHPVWRPLFIHMMNSALEWDGRREHDRVRVAD